MWLAIWSFRFIISSLQESLRSANSFIEALESCISYIDILFTSQSQENMELISSLETERHMAKELAAKLSEMGVELEESKQLVGSVRWEKLMWSFRSEYEYEIKYYFFQSIYIPRTKILPVADQLKRRLLV